ncbi:MAG: hypothetical protein WC162_03835 [Sphaerochaetaceae bacterium]|nr:hypothetical protein [Sphaerochaetaceae bacterium]
MKKSGALIGWTASVLLFLTIFFGFDAVGVLTSGSGQNTMFGKIEISLFLSALLLVFSSLSFASKKGFEGYLMIIISLLGLLFTDVSLFVFFSLSFVGGIFICIGGSKEFLSLIAKERKIREVEE